MILKKYKPLLEVLIVSIVIFFVHKIAFSLLDYVIIECYFLYSLQFLYSFFLASSIFIIFLVIKINSVDINNVGNGFLLLTLIKIGIAYLILNPILESSSKYIETEKINFFIVFAVFLTIETIITIRILNNK